MFSIDKAKALKETDLFEPIKHHFIALGCEVFSEVQTGSGGPRADVVIRNKNIITVIELKTSLSLDLLEQCYKWLGKAHYVYACVPESKNFKINSYASRCMKRDGIGLLNVSFYNQRTVRLFNKYSSDTYNLAYVMERIKPKLYRRIAISWDEYLTEEHKNTLPGGTNGGGYITPYSQMIDCVKRAIEAEPEGIEFARLVHYANDHYAHPKQGLMHALKKFESDWCEVFKKNRITYCRIKQKQDTCCK